MTLQYLVANKTKEVVRKFNYRTINHLVGLRATKRLNRNFIRNSISGGK